MKEQNLLSLKQKIEEEKEHYLSLKGQLDALLQQLKDEWDCDNIEQAKKKLIEMEKLVEKLSDEISEGLESINDKYFPDGT